MEQSRRQQILEILAGPKFGIEKSQNDSLDLYDIALTHSSFVEEMRQKNIPCEDFERLEFFGNYLLDFIVAQYLYESTDFAPGDMNKRIKVTENSNLAAIAQKNALKIDEAVLLGNGTVTEKIVADAFEAFIGAIFFAEGLDKVRQVILGMFCDEIENMNPESNYIGELQEYIAKHSLGELEYKYSDIGPDHKKEWTATVCLKKEEIEEIAEGTGSTKKDAAMKAARTALSILCSDYH